MSELELQEPIETESRTRAEYCHNYYGDLSGITIFNDANEKVGSIYFIGSNEGIGVRSRDPFPGYTEVWDWDQGRYFEKPRDPSEYEFGTRFQYETTFTAYIASRGNPFATFNWQAMREASIRCFNIDPGEPKEPEEFTRLFCQIARDAFSRLKGKDFSEIPESYINRARKAWRSLSSTERELLIYHYEVHENGPRTPEEIYEKNKDIHKYLHPYQSVEKITEALDNALERIKNKLNKRRKHD